MAQARNRFPMDASAKCSGTRSGVSIMRMSSVASVADMRCRTGILACLSLCLRNRDRQECLSYLYTPHAEKLSFAHLNQHGLSGRQAELIIDTRATFVVHLDSALLDQTPRFAHRSGQAGFNQ